MQGLIRGRGVWQKRAEVLLGVCFWFYAVVSCGRRNEISQQFPMVKGRKLQWYGHVSHSPGLAKTILQGTAKGGRRRGRQGKRWEDNIRAVSYTHLTLPTTAEV